LPAGDYNGTWRRQLPIVRWRTTISINQHTSFFELAFPPSAARYRETYHFNYANPREVYLGHARQLLRAKDGECEAPYARLLARHDKLLKSLKKACLWERL